MVEADFTDFRELLDAVCSLLSRGAYVPNATNTALFFRALQEHPIDAVRNAFEAHVKDPQRGCFVPTPADVIAQLQGLAADDGRPGVDEAWGTALQADDEAVTVVWTAETAQALAAARPVLRAGDRVGARMAFKAAYERLVDEARKARRPIDWQASYGHDPRQRVDAVLIAVQAGKLQGGHLDDLPAVAYSGALPLLLTMSHDVQGMSTAERDGRAALRRLCDDLLARAVDESVPGVDGQAKAFTRRRQDEIAQQVQEHLVIGEPISVRDLGEILSRTRRAAGDGLAKAEG